MIKLETLRQEAENHKPLLDEFCATRDIETLYHFLRYVERADAADFAATLPRREAEAYEYLRLAGAGLKDYYVNISALVNQTGVNRTTFNNVLLKMERHGVAVITSAGSKGTRIEMR